MSHVPLSPVGRPRDAFLDAKSFERNREAMRARESTLVDGVHADGGLTTRDRLEKLHDPGTALVDTPWIPGSGAPVGPRTN